MTHLTGMTSLRHVPHRWAPPAASAALASVPMRLARVGA